MPIILNSGQFTQTVVFGSSQNVSFTGTSAQSTAIGTAGGYPNIMVRINSTAPCRINETSSNPTATATDTYISTGVPEYIEIVQGNKIAVIQDPDAATPGKLNITVCILQ